MSQKVNIALIIYRKNKMQITRKSDFDFISNLSNYRIYLEKVSTYYETANFVVIRNMKFQIVFI